MPTVETDWKMPEAPTPGAVATYYLDGDGFFLYWVDPETGEPTEKEDENDIRWPFQEDYATRTDLEAIGFVDSENVG